MSDLTDAEKKKAADLARDGSPQAKRNLIIVVALIVLASLIYTISGAFGYRGKVPFVSQSSGGNGGDSQMSGHPLLPSAVNPPQKSAPVVAPASGGPAPAVPAAPAAPAAPATTK